MNKGLERLAHTRSMRQDKLPRIVVPIAAVMLLALMLLTLRHSGQLSAPQHIFAALSALLFAFSFSSLIGGVWNIGMLPPMCFATYGFCTAVGHKWLMSACPKPFIVVTALFAAAAIVCMYVSALMTRSSMRRAQPGEQVTVVVLGCKVKGDRPSLMLEGRLEAARKYLLADRSVVCILSGGQGSDEDYAEAYIMKRWMIAHGIDSERLIAEERSVSTRENLLFSKQLITKHGLPKKLAIATDRFHQHRAQSIAKSIGLEACAINRETRWYLVMQYWFREIAGIIELKLSGSGIFSSPQHNK